MPAAPPAADPAPVANPAPVIDNIVPVGPGAPNQQPGPRQILFLDEAAAEQARARLIAKLADDPAPKKASLPEVVPGFKASPLSLRKYLVPYPSYPRFAWMVLQGFMPTLFG